MQKANSMLKKPILTLKNKAFWWMIKLFKPSYTMLFYYQAVIMCDFWQKQKGKIVTDKNINVFAELLTGQAFKIMDTETDGELPKYLDKKV